MSERNELDVEESKKKIASVIPYYPFKGIDKFYDITGFLSRPDVFQLVIDLMTHRYRSMNIDAIGGIDARGFVLGPPVALALKIPFFMLRKKGKLPNSVTGASYTKEYAGSDSLCVSRGVLKPKSRVLLVDDLLATGGTFIAAIELLKSLDIVIAECACVVELKNLNGRQKFDKSGHSDVPIWSLIDETLLTLNGLADPEVAKNYVDDGAPH
eukprot:c11831_g1_i1.p1 GENE.c11831_g1_i1~~c11831_g1_i1.p1  ORF type:complete len:223 (-),score=93.34 c11831_g1_i1:21-656(-)